MITLSTSDDISVYIQKYYYLFGGNSIFMLHDDVVIQ